MMRTNRCILEYIVNRSISDITYFTYHTFACSKCLCRSCYACRLPFVMGIENQYEYLKGSEKMMLNK